MSNEQNYKKDGRGGRREGSGRKPSDNLKKHATFYLSANILYRLRAETVSPAKFIEQLLREKFGM